MRQRGRFLEAHLRGHPFEGLPGRAHVLGEGTLTVREQVRQHVVTRLEPRDAGSDRFDDAGDVDADALLLRCAQPGEQAHEPGSGLDPVQVGSVDGGRAHADEDLALARGRPVDFTDLDNVGRAVALAEGRLHHRSIMMLTRSPRNLLPIVAAYLPVPVIGATLSARWDVGATPDGNAGDMFLRGTALTPPLFLPVLLAAGAAAARGSGATGRAGAGVVSLVALAFLAGSTANLPNDVAAARAAGTPVALTVGLAAAHATLALALLANALPRATNRAIA